MALPNKLKSLIDKYCMGVTPSDAQMDEIFNLVESLDADSAEVSAYMQEMMAGPTKEEREAKEEEERKKAAAAAKREAQRKAKQAAERKAKREREIQEAEERRRRAEQEAKEKAAEVRRNTLIGFAICVLIPLALLITSLITSDRAMNNKLFGFGGLGFIISSCFVYWFWESEHKKIAFKFLLLALFYLIPFFATVNSIDLRRDSVSDVSIISMGDSINAEKIHHILATEFGQEYNFSVQSSQGMYIDEEVVLLEITATEKATAKEGNCLIAESADSSFHIYGDSVLWVMPKGKEIYDFVEELIK